MKVFQAVLGLGNLRNMKTNVYCPVAKRTLAYQCGGAVSPATALAATQKKQLARKACGCDAWEGDVEAEKMVTST